MTKFMVVQPPIRGAKVPIKPGSLYDPRCPVDYARKYFATYGRFPVCPNAPPKPRPAPRPMPPIIIAPAPRRKRRRDLRPMPPIRPRPVIQPPAPVVAASPGEICKQQGWTTRPCGDGYKVFACTPGQPVNINPALLCPPSGLSDLLNDCGLGDCSTPAIQSAIFGYADKYGIDRNIALAQIKQESGCRTSVCSTQGACGIAQFIPGTWAMYGKGDRFDMHASLEAWGAYMRHLLDKFGGDYRLALAGYHSGEGSAKAALANPAGNPKTNQYVNLILGSTGAAGAAGAAPAGGLSVLSNLPTAAWVGIAGIGLLMLIRR